jgi:hypothetical protein
MAIRVFAGIMNEGRAPAAARVSAAIALLDRGWGKPEQYHEVTQKVPDQMTDAELNVEIARVAALLGFADSQETPPADVCGPVVTLASPLARFGPTRLPPHCQGAENESTSFPESLRAFGIARAIEVIGQELMSALGVKRTCGQRRESMRRM